MSRKKTIPPSWDPANTTTATFISIVMNVDIDGRQYELTVDEEGYHCKIVNVLTSVVIYDGPDMPAGPFGMEGVWHILKHAGDEIKGGGHE